MCQAGPRWRPNREIAWRTERLRLYVRYANSKRSPSSNAIMMFANIEGLARSTNGISRSRAIFTQGSRKLRGHSFCKPCLSHGYGLNAGIWRLNVKLPEEVYVSYTKRVKG